MELWLTERRRKSLSAVRAHPAQTHVLRGHRGSLQVFAPVESQPAGYRSSPEATDCIMDEPLALETREVQVLTQIAVLSFHARIR